MVSQAPSQEATAPPRNTLAGLTINELTTVEIPLTSKVSQRNNKELIISYRQNTIKIIKMMTNTPKPTPIAAHFQTLLGSSGPAVGDVVGVAGLKTEMPAPIAVSSADL